MHFWIDKRSAYGFGRTRSGYPRRMRPSKPWSTHHHRSTATASSSSTPNELEPHQNHTSSPSYLKCTLYAIAIILSAILLYIVSDRLYHDHQLFTFCALLATIFLLGVCTLSSMCRRIPASDPVATLQVPPPHQAPVVTTANDTHLAQGSRYGNESSPNCIDTDRSPSISIHRLTESPTPTYHHSHHNQYSPPPYHIALEMTNDETTSLPPYDKIQPE